MDFYTWEKRYHLTRWILSFLFFLLGTRNCLHTRACYIHTNILAAFSQLGGGIFLVFSCSLAQDQSRGDTGGHGAMIQKGLLQDTVGGGGNFPDRVISGMIWCIFSIFGGCACERLGGNYSSSLSAIFRVAVAVDIMVYCASLFLRRTHDTACFINKSIPIDVLPDENLES